MTACGIEAQVSDGVACEGLDYSEAVHIFVHSMEVPQSNMVIEASSCHSMSLGFHCAAGYCFGVSIEGGELFNGDSHFSPGEF